MREVTNVDRAGYGRETLEHYEQGRAALGREPDEREEARLVMAACAYGGSLDRWDPVKAMDLQEDTEWALEVIGDLVCDLFHTADGTVTPQLLLDAVPAPGCVGETALVESRKRLGERGVRFADFLAAVRRALVTVHDLDADELFERAKGNFEEEVEEERYNAAAARHIA
ncbi:hypothetical protein [Streptomyces filamentosus]|uniref:hypothetical protein n=1 Tax=Streptomyces filamentosus TaxID=67294 RepID=UPI0033CF944C